MTPLTLAGQSAVAFGTEDGNLHVLAAARRELLISIGAHTAPVRHLATVKVGGRDLVVSSAAEEGVQVRDMEYASRLSAVLSVPDGVTGLASATFGDRAAVIVATSNGTVCVWDFQASAVEEVELPFGSATGVAPLDLPDGTAVAIGTADGAVLLWRPTRGTDLVELHRHDGHVSALVAVTLADGRPALATAGGDGTVRLVDLLDSTATTFVTTPRPTAWLAYREGSAVGDPVAAWGPSAGLERLLLAGGCWTAADVRATFPDTIRRIRPRRVSRPRPAP